MGENLERSVVSSPPYSLVINSNPQISDLDRLGKEEVTRVPLFIGKDGDVLQ